MMMTEYRSTKLVQDWSHADMVRIVAEKYSEHYEDRINVEKAYSRSRKQQFINIFIGGKRLCLW